MTSTQTHPIDPAYPPHPAPASSTSGVAIAGLVFAFLLPLVGLIVSLVALGRTGPGKEAGRGLAVAGLVISGLGSVGGLILGIALVVGVAAGDDTTVVDSAAAEPADAAPGQDAVAPPVGEPSDQAAAPADGAPPTSTAYAVPTTEDWDSLVRDPDSREGDGVAFYAEVFQFDTNTGTGAFLANAGPNQPSREFELEDSVYVTITGDAGVQIAEGDVLLVNGVVDGVLDYETMIGGNNSVASVSAAEVQVVGYRDLTPDVVLGAPAALEYGGAEAEVTITNSGDVAYAYSVDIVAESPDGATQVETAYASADNLAPGQQATVTASFFEDLPEGTILRVASVERYSY